MAKSKLTDQDVLEEIKKLENDPAVRLGRAYLERRNKQRQRLYMLRYYQKKGLECAGVLQND